MSSACRTRDPPGYWPVRLMAAELCCVLAELRNSAGGMFLKHMRE